MMKECPPPDNRKVLVTPWDDLMLGVNSRDTFREIVEDFWPIIVQKLKEVREIDIRNPEEEAWFHLRRNNTNFPNPEPSARKYAYGRIEVLRVKRDFVPQDVRENLRNLTEQYSDVVCAGWWPCSLADRDNSFLSFLQKLSVLRYKGIVHKEFLGQTPTHKEYDKCPHCQEAYRVMIDSSQPWHDALAPWFSFMKSSNMEPDRTHEYAHWFGHILTDWP